MPNINIRTKLGASHNCRFTGKKRIYITRGSTAVFSVNLSEKIYSFEDLYQLSFMFKQGNTIWKFDTFDYEDISGEIVLGEYISISEDHKIITLTLPPEVTVDFEKTGVEDCDEYNLITYEIITQLEVGKGVPDSGDPIIIDPQPKIAVIDSIYAYFADQTICSETTICSDDIYVKN